MFEKIFLWLRILERNILYPCILLGMLTSDSAAVALKFGPHLASVLLTVAGFKFLKLAFRDAECQYLVLAFTFLFFRFDFAHRTEGFLLDYWLVSICYYKLREWLVKWKFVLTYVAPWQITWGISGIVSSCLYFCLSIFLVLFVSVFVCLPVPFFSFFSSVCRAVSV